MGSLLDLVTGGGIPLITQILSPSLYPDSLPCEIAVIPTKKVGCIYSLLESGLIQWKEAEGRVCQFEPSLGEGLLDCAGALYLCLEPAIHHLSQQSPGGEVSPAKISRVTGPAPI